MKLCSILAFNIYFVLTGIVDFEGNSPPLNSSDDRTLRQRNRVRKKVQQRRPDGVYSYPCRHLGRNGIILIFFLCGNVFLISAFALISSISIKH